MTVLLPIHITALDSDMHIDVYLYDCIYTYTDGCIFVTQVLCLPGYTSKYLKRWLRTRKKIEYTFKYILKLDLL